MRLPLTRVLTPLLLLALLTAAVLGLSGCGGDRVQNAPESSERQVPQITQTQKVPVEGGGNYTDVGAEGLAKMLKAKDFPLVNVHIPYEGEIAKTDRFIPYDRIGSNLDELPTDKDSKIVLYCRSGSMSAIAARQLVRSGYTNVWNLDGGMVGWQEAGHTIIERER